MKMIFRPNYDKAEREAYKLLQLADVRDFPVKFKKLTKQFSNLKLRKYSWFAKKWGYTIEEVCELTNSNEGCCWYLKNRQQYLILYNDTIENLGRVRWTIAHEFGHFMLKHNEITNKAIYTRNSLTEEEYDVFEKEANCFARNLLAPQSLIYQLKPTDPNTISDIFNVSFEAANNILNFFINGINRGISYSKDHFTHNLFRDFIHKHKYGKTCLNCSCFFISKQASYCKVCGSVNLIQGEKEHMEYTKFILDNNSRAVDCPTCANEQVYGDYCHVCGTYLINKCTGLSVDEFTHHNSQNRIMWHEEEGCQNLLEGNARFCERCGSASTFYLNKLLIDWEHEYESRKKEELPF